MGDLGGNEAAAAAGAAGWTPAVVGGGIAWLAAAAAEGAFPPLPSMSISGLLAASASGPCRLPRVVPWICKWHIESLHCAQSAGSTASCIKQQMARATGKEQKALKR